MVESKVVEVPINTWANDLQSKQPNLDEEEQQGSQ